MKKSALTSALLFIFGFMATAQPIPQDSLYLGQIPPGNVRKIFNLFADPGYYAVEKIAISPDGKEIYYEETNSSWTSFKIKQYKYSSNHWNVPANLFTGFYCLSLSPDGNQLYFENNNYADSWVSNKQGSAWTPPERFLRSFNVHSLNVTGAGNYYLSSVPEGCLGQRDICKLGIENPDTSLVGLGLPVNSSANEGDFFISNDESFMIVMSNRPGGFGSTDLYLSFKKNNGTWTNPKNMGASVNTSGDDFGPYVIADNKYLFYESGYSSPSSIYWIKADQLIDSLRYTNFTPYVKNPIPDQTAHLLQFFNFTIPDTTFVDDDGNNTLTYSAKLTNDDPLPGWLAFDTITAAFSGMPDVLQALNIKITATDTAGASASTTFKITVEEANAIPPLNEQDARIFPNPTSGLFTISIPAFHQKAVIVEISNVQGETILRTTFNSEIGIDLSDRPKGMYLVKLVAENRIIVRKVCVD